MIRRRRTLTGKAWLKPPSADWDDTVVFTVRCRMRRRWVPQFLGMLAQMEHLGSIGSTRCVTFVSDGDGDFTPKFSTKLDIKPEPAPHYSPAGDTRFDAG